MRHPLDPFGHLPRPHIVYGWLAIFFTRLAVWYLIEDRRKREH